MLFHLCSTFASDVYLIVCWLFTDKYIVGVAYGIMTCGISQGAYMDYVNYDGGFKTQVLYNNALK